MLSKVLIATLLMGIATALYGGDDVIQATEKDFDKIGMYYYYYIYYRMMT